MIQCERLECKERPNETIHHEGCDGQFCYHGICQECGASLALAEKQYCDVFCVSCGHEDIYHTEDAVEFCHGSTDCDCTASPMIVHSVIIGDLLERIKNLEERADKPVRDGHPLWTRNASRSMKA